MHTGKYQSHVAACCTHHQHYQLSTPTKIAHLLNPKVTRMDHQQKKDKEKKSPRTRQKKKAGHRKVESNDSPENPDRWETSDIPGLPSGTDVTRKATLPAP